MTYTDYIKLEELKKERYLRKRKAIIKKHKRDKFITFMLIVILYNLHSLHYSNIAIFILFIAIFCIFMVNLTIYFVSILLFLSFLSYTTRILLCFVCTIYFSTESCYNHIHLFAVSDIMAVAFFCNDSASTQSISKYSNM